METPHTEFVGEYKLSSSRGGKSLEVFQKHSHLDDNIVFLIQKNLKFLVNS